MEMKENVDFYDLDDLLTEEEKSIRETVGRFVNEECMPIIADSFDKGICPRSGSL